MLLQYSIYIFENCKKPKGSSKVKHDQNIFNINQEELIKACNI